ncbi:hypothetical protein ACFTWF_43745 [Rhodococcus sp. NPDC056960]|uniref:hypothetical protein n=1 Tax=Rhodococcus sp. NPDC056960 TaxID=3345982 RepID=UPI00362C5DAB
MTTWTLWLGAVLVVGGSVAHIKHQTVAARVLWALAVLAFVVTGVGAVAEMSLPLAVTLVVAIAATVSLVVVTNKPGKPAATVRRGAQ